MPNYEHSKIYKIVNNDTDLVYYGATTQELYTRYHDHKRKNKGYLTEIFKGNKPTIILVDFFSCGGIEEIKQKLHYYIQNNNCVNKLVEKKDKKAEKKKEKERIENRKKTKKLYDEKNKDKLKEQKKIYNQINKDKIKEKNKIYRENNKDKIKEYNEKNKEIISERSKIKITCECGSTYTKKCKLRHERTDKHKDFINNK